MERFPGESSAVSAESITEVDSIIETVQEQIDQSSIVLDTAITEVDSISELVEESSVLHEFSFCSRDEYER